MIGCCALSGTEVIGGSDFTADEVDSGWGC